MNESIRAAIEGWRRKVKTPRVIQMEAVECGAAALAILLGYYGRYVSLEELRLQCGVSRDGVNAFNMVQAAEHYGLKADGYRVEIKDLDQVTLPAILFWNHNHFVVLEEIQKDRVYINDPAIGPTWVSHEEFARRYSPIVLQMTPTPDFRKGGKPHTLWSDIKERLLPFREAIAFLLCAQLPLVLLGLALPVLSQIFIDKILGESILSWRWGFLGILAAVMLLTGGLTWLQGRFLNKLHIRLNVYFSSSFLWHILQLPMQFFTQRFGGEIINRMHLNTNVAQVLTGQVVITVINLLFIALYALIMLQYDVPITLIGIGAAIFNMTMIMMIAQIRMNAYARMQQEQAKTVGVSLDAISHIETMKTTANDPFFFSRIAGYYTKNINALQDIGEKDVWLSSFSRLSQRLATVVLLGFGCWRVMHGNLTIGMLIALQLLLNNFLRPFGQLVNFAMRIQSFQIDLTRLNDVLKNKRDPLVLERPQETEEDRKLKGNLEMRKVSFGYSPLSEPYIQDFNVSITPGKRVALVGTVGSGKSTIAKLASSLYSPWTGEITYDEKPIHTIPRSLFAASIGHVDQEIFLFGGTIKENLTLWKPEISDEIIEEAVRDACIHEDIIALAKHYETPLIEGGRNFSEGQRQRLEIARALINHPSLLILDEAMSAVDSNTEEEILNNLKKRGCSLLIIAHRFSTIKDCDEIIVLDNGKVVQRGTHEQLKAVPGAYQTLGGFTNG
ncbi:MAG: Lactococcin-G-processing and transport ATP-binding protein LagD [Chlamydiae bacterium]|nr:Lactococcin-G-processing and transport ATP-binding protein LagD [Chlamydiota bacterium]